MKQKTVRYRYALNSQNEVIEVNVAHGVGGAYSCPHCGGEMICRCGTKREWHFAHKRKECGYENYLHSLAERRVLDWLNNSDRIELLLPTVHLCPQSSGCPFYEKSQCRVPKTIRYNLKDWYGLCEKEKRFVKDDKVYVADILCHNRKSEATPLFFEIFVTHECEEEKKMSGIHIIELKIETEEDIDDIIKKPIKRSDRIRLYNFSPKERFGNWEDFNFKKSINKFVLYRSGKGHVILVSCLEANKHRGVLEISVDDDENYHLLYKYGGLFTIGYAYAGKQNNDIKHCCICKYVQCDMFGENICALYKKYGTRRSCIENDARSCQYFRRDSDRIERYVEAFEEFRLENPVDIWTE